ncbi:C-type lectin domain family 2 member E-like [Arvicanthis niloticus]|uniref:C-type lectin domain family 2 member E-like n=1 Tax=Arvicanthis niloticus TaxID=61156 RepID=UPI00402B9EFA
MSAAKIEEASTGILKTDLTAADCLQEGEMGKKLRAKFIKIVSPESHAKLYCCYGVITVLTVAVVALSAALSVFRKTEQISIKNNTYAAYSWTEFRNKCFYISEYSSNWTLSQDSCMAQGAQLARIDSQEEMDFLRRYKAGTDCWIGLHRESSEHPWRWTDNTEYNNWVPIYGDETHGFLSDRISSGRGYIPRKWICSKQRFSGPNSLPSKVSEDNGHSYKRLPGLRYDGFTGSGQQGNSQLS